MNIQSILASRAIGRSVAMNNPFNGFARQLYIFNIFSKIFKKDISKIKATPNVVFVSFKEHQKKCDDNFKRLLEEAARKGIETASKSNNSKN